MPESRTRKTAKKTPAKKTAAKGGTPGGEKGVALYHEMLAHEDFEGTAQKLFDIVKRAATDRPGERRILFLDIEGHRNEAGGFDRDALEIQNGFVLGFLDPYLSEINMPLLHGTTAGQSEDLPDTLQIGEQPS